MTQIRMMMSDTMSLFICFSFLRKPGHDAKNVQKDITYLESGGIKDRLCLRLSNDENKASFEKCFYCQAYVNKVHETCITPAIEEVIDKWICEYYENDATEIISLHEFIFSKINKVVLNNE